MIAACLPHILGHIEFLQKNIIDSKSYLDAENSFPTVIKFYCCGDDCLLQCTFLLQPYIDVSNFVGGDAEISEQDMFFIYL